MRHFKFYDKKAAYSLVKLRKFETKAGERLQYLQGEEWPELLQQHSAKYAVFGIPEDIGVRANHGTGGADTNWYSFLNAFLNVQSNDFFSGEDVLLLGHFDFGDLKFLIDNTAKGEEEKIDAYRHAVNTVDEEVESLVKSVAAAGMIPIAIGGGHNNSYPLLKGAAKGLYKAGKISLAQINAVNLDAHTDYRTMEGRHSGNGFRYAEADGYLGKYAMIGLHENYLQQNVMSDMQSNHFMHYSTYEDIFLRDKKTFAQAVTQAFDFADDSHIGVEADLDAIHDQLSSACSPSGISVLHMRQYIRHAGSVARPAYLHIAEGASQLADGRKDESVGKLISYLVTDFIKAMNER